MYTFFILNSNVYNNMCMSWLVLIYIKYCIIILANINKIFVKILTSMKNIKTTNQRTQGRDIAFYLYQQ